MFLRPTAPLSFLFISLVCVVPSCTWENHELLPAGIDTRLTLLHTSDIHSRLFPFTLSPTAGDRALGMRAENAPFGGAARLAYLIKRERKRSNRVLHLDSGDCFQGAPIFNSSFGEPEFRYQTMVGLDAAVVGNHEFDGGVTNLAQQLYNHAGFEMLAANYNYKDPDDPNNNALGKLTQPFSIFNVKGLKVAVIGMANLGSLNSIVEGGNSIGVIPLEQNETVRSYVNLLHESVDLITIVSHLGLTEDEEIIRGYDKVVWADRVHPNWTVLDNTTEELEPGQVMVHIPGVRNIDVILGGHLHVVLNPPKMITDLDNREVVLSHGGAFAKFLGRLDLVVRDDNERGGKQVVSHKYQVFPVDARLAPYEDLAVTDMLRPYLQDLARHLDLRKVIGYAPTTVMRRSNSGNGDSGLGNLVTASMRTRRRVGAQFAVTNTLGVRDNFYAGPVTLEDMFNVFPFENTLTVMFLSGREVQELVDFIASRSAGRGCQSQAQVDGISFTMNCARVLDNEKNPSRFVSPGENICVGDQPLSPTATYKVATNDYIANGGSGFRVLKRNTTKIDTHISLRDALIDYLVTLKTCGEYERDVAKWCDSPDDLSQRICLDVALAGRVRGQPNAQGAYADVPCIIGHEDERIRRKTSDSFDDNGNSIATIETPAGALVGNNPCASQGESL